MKNPLNLFEFEELARAKLGVAAFEYYAGGANDGVTLHENRRAYDRLRLFHRVMRDVSRRDTTTTIFGQRIAFPALVAPTAFHKMACPAGECATARAAGRAGTIMVVSTLSNSRVEEVAAAATGPIWFQLYIYKDRGATLDLVRRAEAAGCKALVLTVDAQVWGRREADVRNRFSLPADLTVANLQDYAKGTFPDGVSGSGLAAYVSRMLDESITWMDLEWLRERTGLPVLVKGIVRGDDAELAIQHGAAGIVVSNHGGRQLDTSPATIDALSGVVNVVQGRVPVFVDGGVRRGTDIVKALALGAVAVMVGRPVLWGLSTNGEEGAFSVLEMLGKEFDLAMALCGANTVGEIQKNLLG